MLSRRVAERLMAVLVLLVAASAVAALWRPMPPAGAPASPTRSVVDERGRVVALPQAVQTAAVFMAIGAGEYLLVTRRPSDIMTSHSPENARLKASTLLARAFPDLRWLRTTMSPVETGTVNVETLLRDRPDVVVTWARLAAGFERVGLPVVGLGPVSSTERLAQNTAVFSAIVDEPARGADLVQRSYRPCRNRRAKSADLKSVRYQWGAAQAAQQLIDLAQQSAFRFAVADPQTLDSGSKAWTKLHQRLTCSAKAFRK